MDYNFADKYEFVPAFGGNRDDANPAKFYCRYLTGPERDRCSFIGLDADKKTMIRIQKKEYVRQAIIKIENLKCCGVEIKTAEDFLKAPIAELYNEVAEYIMGKESEVKRELKNS